MRKVIRYLIYLITAIIFCGVIWAFVHRELIRYGVSQLQGQLRIVMNSRPMDEVLRDPALPDSVRKKLLFIEEIKRFAVDSLGLKASKNYTTFYNQEGQPLLWVLTACEPYEIKAFHWNFPVLGEVSYKGFFNYRKGRREDSLMKAQGFDTDFGEVSAWSTLGWFKDPILSEMLNRSEGQLAELIIHEMTHATLFFKDHVDFNENLASFVGEQGAILFLKFKYGLVSRALTDYMTRKEDYDKFSLHMLRGSVALDSLYSNTGSLPEQRKKELKKIWIDSIISALDTVSFHRKDRFKALFQKEKPNNAYFINFIRYDAQKEDFKHEMEKSYGGNFRGYLEYLKTKG